MEILLLQMGNTRPGLFRESLVAMSLMDELRPEGNPSKPLPFRTDIQPRSARARSLVTG